jgi:superfamily II DNA or RNA helicase
VQALLDALRAQCSASTWSRAVELARAQAVCALRESKSAAQLQVARSGRPPCLVQLDLDELAWDCDCGGSDDPCEHAAAAAIALRQARSGGAALARAQPAEAPQPGAGDVGYRLRSEGGQLRFARARVDAGGEWPLTGALADGAGVAPREVDRRIERLLGRNLDAAVPPGLMPALLRALADCADVQLDGQPVAVSSEPVLPRAVVEPRPPGWVVRLEPEPGVQRVLSNGAVLCRGSLRPQGDPRLSRRELEQLGGGRYFSPEESGTLLGEVLPGLQARIPVVSRAPLPAAQRCRPWLRLAGERVGDRLRVRAELVYGDPPQARVEGESLVLLQGAPPLRDAAGEQRLAARLRRELGLAVGEETWMSAGAAVELAERLTRRAPGEGSELRAEGAWPEFRRAEPLAPQLEVRGEQLEVAFRSGTVAVGPEAVLQAWRAEERLLGLPGGGFAPLPQDWLVRFGPALEDLLAARSAAGRLPVSALPDLARLCQALGQPVPTSFERLRALVEGFERLPPAELPPDLRATLRPYQEQGVRWLAFLREAGLGALLADDMGLGKTLQVLCALRGRCLVVAPTSALPVWREQAAAFRPNLRTSVYHGAERALDPAASLTLTSYAVLRLDRQALAGVEWDALVLDEAQAIKNPDSQVAQAALGLRGRFRVALTGTPVENRLEELWAQLQFANPGMLGTRSDFRARYAAPIAAGSAATAARLHERLRPFVLRRLKREVARELPPRTEVSLYCELDAEQRAVYDAVLAATRRDVLSRLAAGGSVLEALEALLRLRQAACHPALVPGQVGARRSAKVDVLLESLETALAEGHRALVFSQWTRFLDLLEPELRAAGIAFDRLDGATRDRGALAQRFQAADGPPLLLISLRAGGAALTLTAADHVYLLDPWWNPAVEDQAADRAHRIGQDKPVIVHRLVSIGTVEEGILALQERKRALAERVLAGAGAAASLGREDLLALLA